MTVRTYLDTCVLIAAFQGKEELSERALKLIEDTDREFFASNYLKLELLPKPLFNKNISATEFYEIYLNGCTLIESTGQTPVDALEVAKEYGLTAMDALHITLSKYAGIDEFITAEKPTKPMFKATEVAVKSIYPS